jgi:hypothetical protein
MKIAELEKLAQHVHLMLNHLVQEKSYKHILRICTAFQEKLPKGFGPEQYAKIAVFHANWIFKNREWFNRLEAEFKHEDAKHTIIEQINIFNLSIEEEQPVQETHHIFRELRKIVVMARRGHHPYRLQQGFACHDCHHHYNSLEDIEECPAEERMAEVLEGNFRQGDDGYRKAA